MIPHDYITEWRAQAPWVEDFQVEQDLVISRALVELFSHPALKGALAFRGGTALDRDDVKPQRIVDTFTAYLDHDGHRVTRAQFEENLSGKLQDPQFTGDIGPLLSDGFTWDIDEAARVVLSRLIALLPGDPWKGEE